MVFTLLYAGEDYDKVSYAAIRRGGLYSQVSYTALRRGGNIEIRCRSRGGLNKYAYAAFSRGGNIGRKSNSQNPRFLPKSLQKYVKTSQNYIRILLELLESQNTFENTKILSNSKLTQKYAKKPDFET